MLSQADVSSQHSSRRWQRRHNFLSSFKAEENKLQVSSRQQLKIIKCNYCLIFIYLFFLEYLNAKTFGRCKMLLLLLCGRSERISRHVIMLFDYLHSQEFTALVSLKQLQTLSQRKNCYQMHPSIHPSSLKIQNNTEIILTTWCVCVCWQGWRRPFFVISAGNCLHY